ncbi:MAG: fructosamine kinase family protein [Cyanobacteria bacterium J06641_5]
MSAFWEQIGSEIANVTGMPFAIRDRRSVGGGSINASYTIADGERRYFLKLNQPNQSDMFAAEALGLQQLHQTQAIQVPVPICWGEAISCSYIVLTHLDLSGRGTQAAWETMGRQLAAMHRRGTNDRFGWQRNNTIGSTPQLNYWGESWADFFAEYRIGYQVKLGRRQGGDFPKPEVAIAAVREFLGDRDPEPSLVHGDLWSGNAAMTAAGEPVIFDPAAYYGDREVDLAMTEMFGGFPPAFYAGYNAAWCLDPGYQQRKEIYNLYHILNHFNLFGGGYGHQASRIFDRLLQQI